MNCKMRYLISYKAGQINGRYVFRANKPICSEPDVKRVENHIKSYLISIDMYPTDTPYIRSIKLLSPGRKIRRR